MRDRFCPFVAAESLVSSDRQREDNCSPIKIKQVRLDGLVRNRPGPRRQVCNQGAHCQVYNHGIKDMPQEVGTQYELGTNHVIDRARNYRKQ